MAKQDDEKARGDERETDPAATDARPDAGGEAPHRGRRRQEVGSHGFSGVGPRPCDPNRPDPLEEVGLQDPTSEDTDEDRLRLHPEDTAAADAGAREDVSPSGRDAQDESFERNRRR